MEKKKILHITPEKRFLEKMKYCPQCKTGFKKINEIKIHKAKKIHEVKK